VKSSIRFDRITTCKNENSGTSGYSQNYPPRPFAKCTTSPAKARNTRTQTPEKKWRPFLFGGTRNPAVRLIKAVIEQVASRHQTNNTKDPTCALQSCYNLCSSPAVPELVLLGPPVAVTAPSPISLVPILRCPDMSKRMGSVAFKLISVLRRL